MLVVRNGMTGARGSLPFWNDIHDCDKEVRGTVHQFNYVHNRPNITFLDEFSLTLREERLHAMDACLPPHFHTYYK